MRNLATKSTLIFFTILFAFTSLFSQISGSFSLDESPLPTPTSPVMDYADVLDSATKSRIEERINQFKETSNPSVELAVAIVKTTNGRPIFDYSLAVARGWGIGSRDDDNPGLLLFIAIDDRKYFTQVSRDLEDELPDGLVGSLQRRYLVPQFKRGNYSKGVEDTIDAYIRTIRAKQNNEGIPTSTGENQEYTDPRDYEYNNFECDDFIICLVIIGIIIFIILANSGGGGGGGRGGGRKRKKKSSSSGDFWSGVATGILIDAISNSGGSSGSSWGGSSGGGWGGFGGGGDFGGGGAGGGW